LKRTALRALREVDVIVFCLAGMQWGEDDAWIYRQFAKLEVPVLVVINKTDLVSQKELLLPHIEKLSSECQAVAWVPVSAKKDHGLERLYGLIQSHLPECPHFLFPSGQVTDRDDRFLVSELIREQCLLRFSQEVPHQLTAQVEYMQVKGECLHVHARIWVAREGQKKILLGQRGEHMKHMGIRVRLALEKMFAQKVCLKMWVKVKNDWQNRLQDLSKFGYDGT
jgi:GTP-binding protein Era